MGVAVEKKADEKFCSDCGAPIKVKAEICPNCGVRQHAGEAPNGKSKVAAALFAFFLGGFGAHKFYLGQKGMGFLYLLFFWTFIPAFVAFIEFILLLAMSDAKFNEKYGTA